MFPALGGRIFVFDKFIIDPSPEFDVAFGVSVFA
jgi:hypothetical protein